MLVNILWDEVEIAAKDLAIPHHLPRQKLCKSINFFSRPKYSFAKNQQNVCWWFEKSLRSDLSMILNSAANSERET